MRKTRIQVAEFMRTHPELLGYNRTDKRYNLLCSCGKTIRKRRQQIEAGLVSCQPCNSRFWAGQNRHQFAPHVSLFNMLKERAVRRSISCTLTFDQFLGFVVQKSCTYCGVNVLWSQKQGSIPLDRKDNDLGYTKENCVTCCGECNRIKSDRYSFEAMVRIGHIFADLRTRGLVAV